MEESDGVSSTHRVAGQDTVDDTEVTTMLVKMEGEKRAIREMHPFVTKLSPVRIVTVVKDKTQGCQLSRTKQCNLLSCVYMGTRKAIVCAQTMAV